MISSSSILNDTSISFSWIFCLQQPDLDTGQDMNDKCNKILSYND